MASRNPDLPRPAAMVFSKARILADLRAVDTQDASRQRVLTLEAGFRKRVGGHVASLPAAGSKLSKFSTNPFVLLIYAQSKHYRRLSELEKDILPAKLFSSMETSAGRMVEDVALPVYGWQAVASGMHSANSALDGKKLDLPVLKVATLKSGPRCLNDEMSENFAGSVIAHGGAWLKENAASQLEFTYGVLYGTRKQSNKKDWHILRNIAEKLPKRDVIAAPSQRWDCSFRLGKAPATATVRVGKDWWDYLGGSLCLTEVFAALIRACIAPGPAEHPGVEYEISDLATIVAMPSGAAPFDVVVLQRSQVPWLFFLMRHCCDELTD